MRNERTDLVMHCLKTTILAVLWNGILIAAGVMLWKCQQGNGAIGVTLARLWLVLSLVITMPIVWRWGGILIAVPALFAMWLFVPFQVMWYAVRDTRRCVLAWRAWSGRSPIGTRRAMANTVFAIGLASTLVMSGRADADSNLLTGDTALACNAILCLSSGMRPNECVPALSRYFGISFRDWGDTVDARRDFLNMCPKMGTVMQTRINAIVEGAGRCDAAYLNATNTKFVIKHICPTTTTPTFSAALTAKLGGTAASSTAVTNNEDCYDERVRVISNEAPGYCVSYDDKQFSWMLGVTYEGDPLDGGHWVDDASVAGKPVQ